MDISETIRELYFFASAPRIFSLEELADFTDAPIELKSLKRALLHDSRFIAFPSKCSDKELFILDSVLFKWFIHLNIRLAKIRQFSLSKGQIISLFNQLRFGDRIDCLPMPAIRWANRFGLVCPCRTNARYMFPLAKLLSFMKKDYVSHIADVLPDLCEYQVWNVSLRSRMRECVKCGFAMFNSDVIHIVKCREALMKGGKKTLQELGLSFGLTRERIRQKEEIFWISIDTRSSYTRPFLEAFLCDFMSSSGALVTDVKSRRAPLSIFLAKCMGVPYVELKKMGLALLAVTPKEMVVLKSLKIFDEDIVGDEIAERLDLDSKVVFSYRDLSILSKKIAIYNQLHLAKCQKVYLALRSIGRPAHFSEITAGHNAMWPESASKERNIHAVLGRQRLGIVWIGIKGTYALKEWGYERPSKSLYETVAEIVKNKYAELGKPVPMTVITAELGRYRRIVNPSSLTIVLNYNPKVQCMGKDTFVPRNTLEDRNEELSLEKLDKMFAKFQEKAGS